MPGLLFRILLHQPGNVEDPLTDLPREGARYLLAQAVEAEVAEMLSAPDHLRTEDRRRRLVRHGHDPEREILTGIGLIPVRRAKLRNCDAIDPSAPGRWMRFCPCSQDQMRFIWEGEKLET